MYRELKKPIDRILDSKSSQIILILGLRQTGKTTLAKAVCSERKYQMFNFDLASDQQEFAEASRHSLANFAKRYKNQVIFVDEVQKLPEATGIIKYLYDNYKIKFILTGSSELKIRKNFGDSLTGRIKHFKLYPLSLKEILVQEGQIKETEMPTFDQSQIKLQSYLIFGSLPNLENILSEDHIAYLKDFVDSLLSKDVLEISDIRKSTKIYALSRFLAMQIGQLVNVNELANLLELSRPSLYKYLDILEQLNIIERAYPVSTKKRKSISEKFKVYFTDLGVRNLLVNNFESFQTRLDRGALLENAVYLGIKRNFDYSSKLYKMGFFRSKSGSEIDIVVQNEKESLYEVKVSKKYMNKKGEVRYITQSNAWEYLL